MRDISELIRQREAETARLHHELERIDTELEALKLAARLLTETPENARVAAAAPQVVRETPAYTPAPAARPAAAPAPTPAAWASAKQFP